MPVDGNIERVVSRLYAVEEPLPQASRDSGTGVDAARPSRAGDEKSRAGDSAQALMDLGSSICTPKKPACALCPLERGLRRARARRSGDVSAQGAEEDGRRCAAGAAFIVTRGDELLVRTRAEKGLLGGMTEVPGSDWLAGQDDEAALKQAPCARRAQRAGIARRASSPTCSRIFRWSLWSIPPTVGAHAGAGGHALGADRNAGR